MVEVSGSGECEIEEQHGRLEKGACSERGVDFNRKVQSISLNIGKEDDNIDSKQITCEGDNGEHIDGEEKTIDGGNVRENDVDAFNEDEEGDGDGDDRLHDSQRNELLLSPVVGENDTEKSPLSSGKSMKTGGFDGKDPVVDACDIVTSVLAQKSNIVPAKPVSNVSICDEIVPCKVDDVIDQGVLRKSTEKVGVETTVNGKKRKIVEMSPSLYTNTMPTNERYVEGGPVIEEAHRLLEQKGHIRPVATLSNMVGMCVESVSKEVNDDKGDEVTRKSTGAVGVEGMDGDKKRELEEGSRDLHPDTRPSDGFNVEKGAVVEGDEHSSEEGESDVPVSPPLKKSKSTPKRGRKKKSSKRGKSMKSVGEGE